VHGNTGSNGNIIGHSGDTQLKECVRTVVDVEHGNCDETDTPVLPGDNTVHNICDDVSATESVAYFLSDEEVADSSSVLPIFHQYNSASVISGTDLHVFMQ